ncbi:hypothetical protein [Streptomyces tsukubensis]|uniref:Uncharacterized protein n=1 Tax=Streptomyces tsukubensis TaxID=83656 RepID=A0A1V4A0D4_9ACTN|nr:hypothetical protein [Streptomyces tsukubensis]OON71951.1 hypothetical protein B1H18_31860 [Streptomyces tsukubensis]QFR96900.1 hypothetical protein GBW32_32455 [Streptomyces tsukubensis]
MCDLKSRQGAVGLADETDLCEGVRTRGKRSEKPPHVRDVPTTEPGAVPAAGHATLGARLPVPLAPAGGVR